VSLEPEKRSRGSRRTWDSCYSADRSGDDRCARLSEILSAQSDSRPSPHQARRRSAAGASRRSCVSARLSSRGGGCRLCADPVEDGRVALVVDSVCFGVGGSEQAEQESQDRRGGPASVASALSAGPSRVGIVPENERLELRNSDVRRGRPAAHHPKWVKWGQLCQRCTGSGFSAPTSSVDQLSTTSSDCVRATAAIGIAISRLPQR